MGRAKGGRVSSPDKSAEQLKGLESEVRTAVMMLVDVTRRKEQMDRAFQEAEARFDRAIDALARAKVPT